MWELTLDTPHTMETYLASAPSIRRAEWVMNVSAYGAHLVPASSLRRAECVMNGAQGTLEGAGLGPLGCSITEP